MLFQSPRRRGGVGHLFNNQLSRRYELWFQSPRRRGGVGHNNTTINTIPLVIHRFNPLGVGAESVTSRYLSVVASQFIVSIPSASGRSRSPILSDLKAGKKVTRFNPLGVGAESVTGDS